MKYMYIFFISRFQFNRMDWLYSQKYDRENASIKRSMAQSLSRSMTDTNDESAV